MRAIFIWLFLFPIVTKWASSVWYTSWKKLLFYFPNLCHAHICNFHKKCSRHTCWTWMGVTEYQIPRELYIFHFVLCDYFPNNHQENILLTTWNIIFNINYSTSYWSCSCYTVHNLLLKIITEKCSIKCTSHLPHILEQCFWEMSIYST